MTPLTRRQSSERRDTWHMHCDDVQVGTITRRAGAPVDSDPWGWSCGFYPGVEPYDHQDGTAATFEEARADFEMAWQHLALTLPEEAFQDWRDYQAMTTWKYEMHDRGLPLPTVLADGQSRCFCRIEITSRNMNQHILRQHGFQGYR